MDGYLTRFVNSVNIAILYRCIRKLVCGQISRIILGFAHAFALPEFGSAYVHLQACCSAIGLQRGAISAPDAISAPGFADGCET